MATIFDLGKNVFVTANGKKSIYKKELFKDCITDKEKKALRIKLRKHLDKYIESYLANKKNETQLKQLRDTWKQYSEQVYNDVNIIFDTNKKDTKIYLEFLECMNSKKNK